MSQLCPKEPVLGNSGVGARTDCHGSWTCPFTPWMCMNRPVCGMHVWHPSLVYHFTLSPFLVKSIPSLSGTQCQGQNLKHQVGVSADMPKRHQQVTQKGWLKKFDAGLFLRHVVICHLSEATLTLYSAKIHCSYPPTHHWAFVNWATMHVSTFWALRKHAEPQTHQSSQIHVLLLAWYRNLIHLCG